MPRSLQVIIQCDNCQQQIGTDEHHEGALTISINTGGVKQIDLCDECLRGGELTAEGLISIYTLADTVPTPPRPAATRRVMRGDFVCPALGCDVVKHTPQALGRHTTSAHHATVKELRKMARG